MRPQDLFIEAAKYVRPDPYAFVNSPERKRLDMLELAVRQRAATLIDDVFERFADNSDTDSSDQQFEDVEDGSNVWSGKAEVSILPDGQDPNFKELTKRWVSLETPAEKEFQVYAPEGFYVRKRILIGVHDLRFSPDGAKNWGEAIKSASLEVITGLFTEFYMELGNEAVEENTIIDPFENGPVILERLDYRHPVFNKHFVHGHGFGCVPDEKQYQIPHEMIEAIHASLDDFEKVLI